MINGIIYKITSLNTIDVYYGSSIQKDISKRWSKHLDLKYNTTSSKDIIMNGDVSFEILEDKDYDDIITLKKREQFYIDNDLCSVNERYAYNPKALKMSQKKYYDNNTDKFKQKFHNYYENNKELLLNRKKMYNELNKEKLNKLIECECGGHYQFKNKSIHIKSKKHINFSSSS
jgi:hypothetical protein